MSLSPIEVGLTLVDEKVRFEVSSAANPNYPITFDYPPPLGSGEGLLGLEGLTMSFAGCVSTAIVALLRRTGKTISDYKMKVYGIKKETPLMLEKIRFEITVESSDLTDEEVQNAMTAAGQISPVWIAIKNNVEVEGSYKIIKP